MKHILEDGRILLASYSDIESFFKENKIIGRVIKDIRCSALDYMVKNLNEIENASEEFCDCEIQTDGTICLLFSDGDNLEIYFSGDGPLVLGFNTADFDNYPEPHGECYSVRSLFRYAIGYQIINVMFEKTEHRMLFPVYDGINMAGDDEGIQSIKMFLRGGTYLVASGAGDFFHFDHIMDLESGTPVSIPYRFLLAELKPEAIVGTTVKNDLAVTDEHLHSFSSTPIDDSELDELFGTFGFKDDEGRVVIQPQYLSCGEFHHGLCPVALNRTWCKTPDGKEYYQMHWGYIDHTGKTVIPFKYERAYDFNKYGVALVVENPLAGVFLIDADGNRLPDSTHYYISPYYDYEDRFFEFSNIDCEENHNIGLYDTKERRILIPPETLGAIEWTEYYIEVQQTDIGSTGILDSHYHIINSKGEELFPKLIEKRFNCIRRCNSEGLLFVGNCSFIKLPDDATSWFPINGEKYEKVWHYGVCDTEGNILIPLKCEGIKEKGNRTFECILDGGTSLIKV